MLSRKSILIANIVWVSILIMILAGCGKSTTPTTLPPTTGGIQIVVLDPDQNILSGVKIVSDEQPARQLKVTGITTEDKNGVIFSDLTPGQYVFQLSRADYQGIALSINVVAGQTPSTTITLTKAPGEIVITPSPITY